MASQNNSMISFTRKEDIMPVYPDVISTVGRTPLIKLNRIVDGAVATIALKGEFFNPLGSVKDRIGYAMIAAAERNGVLTPETAIIEFTWATQGSRGVCGPAKGYKLILTMPESMSMERRALLALLGAKLVLTPATEGMKGAIQKGRSSTKKSPSRGFCNSSTIPPTPRSIGRPRRRRSGRIPMGRRTS